MTFEELNASILELSTISNLDFFIVGYSTLNQPIYGVHLGSYEGKQILIEGGIHAREYPASMVVIDMINYLSTQELNGGVYAIPLTNPDGARIVLDGIDWIKCQKLKDYITNVNNNTLDFSAWKANAMTVDLNVNFDALWGEGSQNVFCPSPENFVGFYPNSEREVRELIDFTYRVQPNLTLSFHTKGEVIYYGFETLSSTQLERDRNIANYISTINGYTPTKTEYSVGGYSDWVSEYLGVPAFTIEIAPVSAPTPVPTQYVPEAFEKNKDLPSKLLDYLNENSI